jgi:hypothetical protein
VAELGPRTAFRTAARGILGFGTQEYVIAATDEHLHVLRLRRPGLVSSRLDGVEESFRRPASGLEWDGKQLTVGGKVYAPIPFHRSDAGRVARIAMSAGEPR